MTTLYLIRHAHTDHTPEGKARDQGHLSQLWRQQAIQLSQTLQASGLTFDAIYSSHLARVIETITPYAIDISVTPTILPGLREFVCTDRPTFLREIRTDRSYQHLDSESIADLTVRAMTTIQTILDSHPSGDVAVVTSGFLLRAFLTEAFSFDALDHDWFKVSNPDIYKVTYADGQRVSHERCLDLLPADTLVREHS